MWTCPVTDADQDHNIGIALDADTLVIDEDVRDGKQGEKSIALLEAIYQPLPKTLTVQSASGGRHRYYRTGQPVANSSSKVAKHVDIKSQGGFAVAPGSTIDGVAYEIINDAPIAPCPKFIHGLAGAPRERNSTDSAIPLVELDSADAISRAIDYLTNKAPDHGTYNVAARVKDFGVSEEKCTELMLEHWRDARLIDKDDAHIEFRIRNAYQYGQNAPGIASAEAEFEAVEIDVKPAAKRKGLYAIRWGDAKPVLDQPFLIDGIMDLGTMVVTYGDSNAGKTYVKLDQCFHVAAGRDWNGHKVKQGLVVYVAAEGGTGFLKRIEAFKRHYDVADIPFSLVPCPIDLFSEQGDTGRLVKLIKAEEDFFGAKCVLVIIDTLARAMAGGDENTAKDMGVFVTHVDRIRAATGATADIIHHTGKDKAKGARGSSALRAATDTELEVAPGVLTVAKQRDMAKVSDLNFDLDTVEVGTRSDGKAVTACVVRWIAAPEFDDRLSPQAEQMFEILEQMIAEKQDESGEAERDKADIRIPWQEWLLSCLSSLKGARGNPISRSVLFRMRTELSQIGRIKKDKHNQWFI